MEGGVSIRYCVAQAGRSGWVRNELDRVWDDARVSAPFMEPE